MRYQIKRASGRRVTAEDVPGFRLEEEPITDAFSKYYVDVPDVMVMDLFERMCDATRCELIVEAGTEKKTKVLTIYDDYVE